MAHNEWDGFSDKQQLRQESEADGIKELNSEKQRTVKPLSTLNFLSIDSSIVNGELQERKEEKADEMLKQSEKRHRSLVEAVPDMLFRYSVDGVYLDVEIKSDNLLMAKGLRFYRSGSLIGSRVEEVLEPAVAGPLMEGIRKAASTGEIQVVEYDYFAEKQQRYFEARLVPTGPNEVTSIVREVTDRKMMETALQYQIKFEKMVAEISSSFVDTSMGGIDEAISGALEMSGKFFQADRSYLFRFDDDYRSMSNTHEWCAPGITSHRERNQNYAVDRNRWWVEQCLAGNHVQVYDVEALPAAMESDKKEFRAEDITSFLTIPLIKEGKVFGYFGFDGVKEKKSWSEEQINLLKVVAEIISGAIVKNETEGALKESERRYREILNTMEEGYYEADLTGKITFCNEAACRILGYKTGELKGLSYKQLYKEPDAVYKSFNQVFLSGKPAKGLIREMIRKDGSPGYMELSISLLRDKDGVVKGFKGIGRDVTERIENEKRLEYLSLHDQLTGLYNRFFFEAELERLDGSRYHPITIITADVDGLKLINDTMGHDAGDLILKRCAGVLKNSMRRSDILARTGGDEFSAILPQTDHEVGESVVKRIKNNIGYYNRNNRDLPLSLSIGAATSEESDFRLRGLFKLADSKMYKEKLKHSGSGRAEVVQGLMTVLSDRDYIMEGHVLRLENLCRTVGEKINLSVDQLSNLALLAQVHDLGKVGIPDHVLFKPGPLSSDEWNIMREHPKRGYRIALLSPDLASVADLILKHRERWDGRGYPLGLKKKEIPLLCRILAIADAYDAMTSKRLYNELKTKEEAVAELKANAGSQFDPELVPVFLQVLEEI